MRKIILIAFAVFVGVSVSAQESDNSKIKLTSVSMQLGIEFRAFDEYDGLNEFQKLAPESILLNRDFTGFSVNDSWTLDGVVGIGAKFHFNLPSSKLKSRSELRLGFQVNDINLLTGILKKRDVFRIDTLISTDGNSIMYNDSTVLESYHMYYSQNQIGLNADYTIGGDKANRFRTYIGAGIGIGYSFNSKTRITNYLSHSEYREGSGLLIQDCDYEIFENKNSINARFYIPLGFDLKLSNNNEKWNKAHLILEFTSSFNYASIPEASSLTYMTYWTCIGFKYDF